MTNLSSVLCFTGVALFALGLLTGLGISRFRSPRLGLSAHLAAVQSGVALIAFGFLWPHIAFWSGWAAPLAHTLWLSLYVVWAGLVLAALWGTGRSLPIAGAGYEAKPWQERAAFTPVALGSLATLAAVAGLLIQWRWVG